MDRSSRPTGSRKLKLTSIGQTCIQFEKNGGATQKLMETQNADLAKHEIIKSASGNTAH